MLSNVLPQSMQSLVGRAFQQPGQIDPAAMLGNGQNISSLLGDAFPNGSVMNAAAGPQFGGSPTSIGNDFRGAVGELGRLGGQIEGLQKQLTSGVGPDGKKLTDAQKFQSQLKLQQAMQQRMQLMTMLTNLLRNAHETAMAVIRNIR